MVSAIPVRSIGVLFTTFSMGILLACAPQKPVSDHKATADLFSDRPIIAMPDVFVVTLESPALLTAGRKTASGWKIPDSAKEKVLQEQEQVEKQLRAIDPSAKVVYRYRFVLNGLAIFGRADRLKNLAHIAGIKSVTPALPLERPAPWTEKVSSRKRSLEINSVNFIGGDKAHALGFTGKGLRIGVLDTGIDYTHIMLGGSGAASDYKAIDPRLSTPAFPNRKVVGGIDLVGGEFNANSPLPLNHLPIPDSNPLDESGHGTHVAGTIAGVGDGINHYSGVAPDAELYAIKVFGKSGSTIDAAVVAGLEYSADPNGDLNPDDQLDVLNLSLGGGYGQPQNLYAAAIRTLSQAGTVIVASAGNSGAEKYIVGAPSTADEALSVAASIDGALHNWQFDAVRFITPADSDWLVKAVEGPISKPIAEADGIEGDLLDLGLADSDLPPAQQEALKGKVALIERGKNTFNEKLKRAFEAGAIGAVVTNNVPGNPLPMSGEPKVEIPAIMISQAVGQKIREDMKMGVVRIRFKTDEKIREPELVDTITDFSSQGPRSEDNRIKPEIAAPGAHVISAAMGQGTGSVEMDGTSMAAPHMTGVIALLKQAHPQLDPQELKSLAMNTTKILGTKNKDNPLSERVSLQGAGRIQLVEALKSPVLVQPAALSLGHVQLKGSTEEKRFLTLRNLSDQPLNLVIRTSADPGLALKTIATVALPARSEKKVAVQVQLFLQDTQNFMSELNGRVIFSIGGQDVAQIPVMAIRTPASEVQAMSGAPQVNFKNSGTNDGLALAFNLLGESAQKNKPKQFWKSTSCDLQSAGYRILRERREQSAQTVLQVAIKLFSPVTTWHNCQVSVLVDNNGDGLPEQEIAGAMVGQPRNPINPGFSTILLDSVKARDLRIHFEKEIAAGKADAMVNYQSAILGLSEMLPFPHSSVAVVTFPLDKLAKRPDGSLSIKVAVSGDGDVAEADDFIGGGLGEWISIPSRIEEQPYFGMDAMTVVPQSGAQLRVQKGSGFGRLIIYYPSNHMDSVRGADSQGQIL